LEAKAALFLINLVIFFSGLPPRGSSSRSLIIRGKSGIGLLFYFHSAGADQVVIKGI